MEEHNLYDQCQFAYKRGHSTQTCLIRWLDEIRYASDHRQITIAVSIHFSKAFDRVNYHTLLQKLKQLNFSRPALSWICSYLSGRRQAVRDPHNGALSSYEEVGAGVPQGSVLGPLLFVIYISDIFDTLKYCNYNGYADDLVVYLHCDPRDIHSGIFKVNDDIQRIVEWADANAMLINSTKTQAIIVGTNRYISSINLDCLPSIVVNNVAIGYQTEIKYLGVIINNTLSWEKNTVRVTGRVCSVLH